MFAQEHVYQKSERAKGGKMGEAKATRVPSIGRIMTYKTSTEELPAIVVKVYSPTTLNLKVFLDNGGPDLHVTSVPEGTTVGCWHWPVQV
jgi:hypothetical protein